METNSNNDRSDTPTLVPSNGSTTSPNETSDENKKAAVSDDANGNGASSNNKQPSKFVFYQPHEKLEGVNSGPTDKIVPHKFDILCGRDKVCHNHIGNHRFRVIIEMYRVPYQTAPTKDEKMRITKEIVTTVTSNGFRFLKKATGAGSDTEEWTELDEALARDKVSHALRGAKDPHQNQPRRKQQQTNASNRRKNATDGRVLGVGSPVLSALVAPIATTTATKKTTNDGPEPRRKRSDSASSTSTSGSESTSSGASDSSPGVGKTPKLSNLPKSQHKPLPPPPPPPPPDVRSTQKNDFMSMESIGQSLQRQASLHIDDFEPLPVHPVSNHPSFDSLSRHQRFLEISRRQGAVLQDALADSFTRKSIEQIAAARVPQPPPNNPLEQQPPVSGAAGTARPLQAPPRLEAPISNKQQLVTPIGVISYEDDDDDDEDEPPTIAELMNDRLLREALLDSQRQQKSSDYVRKEGEDNEYDDQTGTPMLESIRSVQTFMSSFSQQQHQQQMDSVRSVDSIMSTFASKSLPRSDLEPLPFREIVGLSSEDAKADSVRSVDAIMALVSKQSDAEPLEFGTNGESALQEEVSHQRPMDSVDMIMSLVSKSSLPPIDSEPLPLERVHRDGDIHGGVDDDDYEPPTITELMDDNMLCEALLGSLRLDPFKSQDDLMSSNDKIPSP